MKSLPRSGQTTVNYDYDAGERLVRRTKDTEVTMSYWLGLNKIAEERDSGAAAAVVRPDSEADWDSTANGWAALGSEVSFLSF